MQIRLLLSICSLTFSLTSLAASAPIDSIGVENSQGKKTIIHKVAPKESYYSISRMYNVSPQSVINFNNNVSLQIGATIKVPTDRPFTNESPKNSQNVAGSIIEYKVGPKETLYSISKRFNTSVENIQKLNNLNGTSLAEGQILKIAQGNNNNQITPPPPVALQNPATMTGRQEKPTSIDSSVNASDRLKLPPSRYGLREVDERGVALWISDEDLDNTKMLALHRSAPIGTVIKITNPMTGKSTFAKVVGKFTENESTKDVIIVLTKATADMVGALDKRFQVNLVYGVPNE
ncbi:MAG TPA: LysM peptidoglycan-binding domain-containing protein [Daejeonella sp.]|nr:LysM peptidoglycan-binding domain-containing protein [Daejeonella sp.]